jgi:hypothetical protein
VELEVDKVAVAYSQADLSKSEQNLMSKLEAAAAAAAPAAAA